MKRCTLILLCIPVFLSAQAKVMNNVWVPFDYFVGSWEGHETGAAGIGKGERTYEYIMNGKYLYFRNISRFES